MEQGLERVRGLCIWSFLLVDRKLELCLAPPAATLVEALEQAKMESRLVAVTAREVAYFDGGLADAEPLKEGVIRVPVGSFGHVLAHSALRNSVFEHCHLWLHGGRRTVNVLAREIAIDDRTYCAPGRQ